MIDCGLYSSEGVVLDFNDVGIFLWKKVRSLTGVKGGTFQIGLWNRFSKPYFWFWSIAEPKFANKIFEHNVIVIILCNLNLIFTKDF